MPYVNHIAYTSKSVNVSVFDLSQSLPMCACTAFSPDGFQQRGLAVGRLAPLTMR